MGDSLIAMSLFNSLNEPVHLTTADDSYYNIWKSVFCVGDQVSVTIDNNHPAYPDPPHPRFLESFKVYNRYLEPEKICLFGQTFPTGRRGKKSVAIFVNNGNDIKDSEFFNKIDTSREYPYLKFHPWFVYEQIIKLVQAAGYDPVIIDHKHTPIEHKIFLLNELCDFVIGYEGGMCHIAHCLRLPVIMLPRRERFAMGAVRHYVTDFLHIDNRTYFVRQLDEILYWSPAELLDKVDGLYKCHGYNNQWMTQPGFPDPKAFVDHWYTNSSDQFRAQHDWVIAHMDRLSLGGY